MGEFGGMIAGLIIFGCATMSIIMAVGFDADGKSPLAGAIVGACMMGIAMLLLLCGMGVI